MKLLVVLAAFAVLSVLLVVAGIRRKKKIPTATAKKLTKQWQHVLTLTEPSTRVLEAEKVIDGLFQELGYSGTFADKLKEVGPLLSNTEAVWQAHKLRNRIAHEAGIRVSEKEATIAVKAFSKVLHSYL